MSKRHPFSPVALVCTAVLAIFFAGLLQAAPAPAAPLVPDRGHLVAAAPGVSTAASTKPSPRARFTTCRRGYVALTIDDGPTTMTPRILDILSQWRAKATFFNIGAREQAMPDMVRRTAAAGHDFGNHSYDHAFLDELSDEALFNNLLGTNQIHEQITGSAPRWFRPPYGRTDDRIRATAAQFGMQEVLWTNDTQDWRPTANIATIVRDAVTVGPGGVVLIHDGYEKSAKALPLILAGLALRGLCPGSLQTSDRPIEAWEGTYHRVTAGPWN